MPSSLDRAWKFRSYLDFVNVLDKMLSQNIDIGFLGEDVPREDERGRPKGTIQLLQDWFEAVWLPASDASSAAAFLRPLKDIRKQRQRPAHKVEANAYDLGLFEKQKDLMDSACQSLMALATALSKNPDAASVAVPDILSRILVY